MMIRDRVLIAGAGPVGMVAAASLVRHGVPVTVLEANATLRDESRASTFHPPTLDMLDALGAAGPLIAQGLTAPQFQYRSRDRLIAQFDFSAIGDATAHPFRLQCEQSRLTRILLERLRGNDEVRDRVLEPGAWRHADRRRCCRCRCSAMAGSRPSRHGS